MCRSQQPLAESVKNKISNFCHVPPEQVGVHYGYELIKVLHFYYHAVNIDYKMVILACSILL